MTAISKSTSSLESIRSIDSKEMPITTEVQQHSFHLHHSWDTQDRQVVPSITTKEPCIVDENITEQLLKGD